MAYKFEMISKTSGMSQAETYAFPASFAQQRLWFLDRLVPGNPFYNVSTAVRLTGRLDTVALGKTLNEVVRRHETLRSTFHLIDGQLMQTIAPFQPVPLPLVECAGSDVQKLAIEEAHCPFNLAKSLLRIKLLRVGETDQVLLLTLHHIVADGWSIAVLMQELSRLYAAFVAHLPSPLPQLPIQYADFASWQRDRMQGEVLETQLGYWKQQLADLPLLDLPTDYPRLPVSTYRGKTLPIALSSTLSKALEDLSQRAGVTLFITLLAAFQTLLYRYTGQTDMAIGSPIANRNRSEVEGLIGFFVNTLVLRNDLSGNPTFLELLERVRSIALEAYTHQDLPFERLVEALQPDRQLSHTPLVQAMFALQPNPTPPLHLVGLDLEVLEVESHVAKFDLTLSFENTARGLKGSLEYSTDLFADLTIARLLEQFQILLEGIVAQPDCPIAQLPLLTPSEQQLLQKWNNTRIDYPRDRLVHQLFEAQAAQSPDALALAAIEPLTYRQLNDRANQLAHDLQQRGVKPEVLVGLWLDRSPNLVIAMLAVLKAGGAYVPIDPACPPERASLMLRGVSLLVTQKGLPPGWSDDIPTVCLDRHQAIGQPLENPVSDTTSQHLAYVIYTSGSTGQPKGVAIEHRSLLNLIFWHQRTFQISPSDRASQIAAPAFDACGWEILPYLAAGASVHFPDASTRLHPEKLRDWFVSERITIGFLPTPLAERMLPLDWSGTALRSILIGGDKLQRHPPKRLPFAVINNYGPTENTVVATSAAVASGEKSPAIGRAIDNTRLYLLGESLQLMPIGAKGELYIGGDGLARGYVNDPEQTAACFIPNPFAPGRLYKTGDLARYRADGSLEFLGRSDSQVKIRGFRIELGDVEQAILQHPTVKAAIVIVETVADDRRLVAFVTLHSPNKLVVPLPQFLKGKLPAYMIPAAFIALKELPLTTNGKIDRVTVAEQYRIRVAEQYRATKDSSIAPDINASSINSSINPSSECRPRTTLEATLANLWAEVLGIKSIGIFDSFFERGGHSLLATQLTSRIRDALRIEVPLQTLFESSTVAEMAAYIETVYWAAGIAVAPNNIAFDSQPPTLENLAGIADTSLQCQQEACHREEVEF